MALAQDSFQRPPSAPRSPSTSATGSFKQMDFSPEFSLGDGSNRLDVPLLAADSPSERPWFAEG